MVMWRDKDPIHDQVIELCGIMQAHWKKVGQAMDSEYYKGMAHGAKKLQDLVKLLPEPEKLQELLAIVAAGYSDQ